MFGTPSARCCFCGLMRPLPPRMAAASPTLLMPAERRSFRSFLNTSVVAAASARALWFGAWRTPKWETSALRR